jgi:hypothetical protein
MYDQRQQGQSTLEWVVGAAVILSTLVAAVVMWNQGLAHKIAQLVQEVAH